MLEALLHFMKRHERLAELHLLVIAEHEEYSLAVIVTIHQNIVGVVYLAIYTSAGI